MNIKNFIIDKFMKRKSTRALHTVKEFHPEIMFEVNRSYIKYIDFVEKKN